MNDFFSALAEIGGLAGLAALITALVQLRHIRRDAKTSAVELTHNHGSSMKDAVARIEGSVKSLGHQVGEIRRDAAITHELLAHRLDEHHNRLDKLE